MLKIFFKRKSQAMVEMAILGTLVLVALGMLVTYIDKLNNDQYTLMQAFRYALAKSHRQNKVVAYGTWDDRRMASATQPKVGDKVTSSAAGYVLWAVPSVQCQGEDPEAEMWVNINSPPFGSEYNITHLDSGAIKPRYFTQTGSTVTADSTNGSISTERTAWTAEEIIYEIDEKMPVGQIRVKGR